MHCPGTQSLKLPAESGVVTCCSVRTISAISYEDLPSREFNIDLSQLSELIHTTGCLFLWATGSYPRLFTSHRGNFWKVWEPVHTQRFGSNGSSVSQDIGLGPTGLVPSLGLLLWNMLHFPRPRAKKNVLHDQNLRDCLFRCFPTWLFTQSFFFFPKCNTMKSSSLSKNRHNGVNDNSSCSSWRWFHWQALAPFRQGSQAGKAGLPFSNRYRSLVSWKHNGRNYFHQA